MQVLVERCAFLDVHRDSVVACARVPDAGGGRREEVAEFATTVSQLLVLGDWLVERRVTLVGMEATGAIMCRVETPSTVDATEEILIPASWSTFSSRWIS